jgi:tetratricopeptide (TPR) repeat protein
MPVAILGICFLGVSARSEPPTLFDPLTVLENKKPSTRKDLDHLESLRLYAEGLICERNHRLVEALKHLEKARLLDPESTAILKALAPLYLALDRSEDALKTCERIVELDPGDFETWYLYARQLKALDRPKDSLKALARAVACPGLKLYPNQRMQMTYDLAVGQENSGDLVNAEANFRQVVALLDDPNTLLEEELPLTKEDLEAQASEILERLGRLALKTKNFESAKVYYQRAQAKVLVKEPSRAKRLSFNLAEVFVAKGDYDGALPFLDEYLAMRPQGLEAYHLKVDLLQKQGKGAKALAFLKDAVENDTNNDGLKLLLARQCHQEARQETKGENSLTREATRLCLELAKSNPSVDTYRELFSVWKDEGRLDKLIQYLDADLKPHEEEGKVKPLGRPKTTHGGMFLLALRDDPVLVRQLLGVVNDQIRRGQRPFHFNTTIFLAILAQRAKELPTAERLYSSSLDTVGLQGTDQEAEVYFGLLQVLWQANKYEAVTDLCRRALKDSQTLNRALFFRESARALAYLGRAEEAIANANNAVDIASGDMKLLCRRARVTVYLQLDRAKEAIDECLAMLNEYKLASDVHSIRYVLSAAYSQAKDLPRATEQLTLILEDNPDDATAHNDLGYLWADHNQNLEEAEKHIRLALELDHKQRSSGKDFTGTEDEDNAAYIDSLGWILFRRGKVKEALVELEKAAAMEGGKDDPVMWDHLGDVYMGLKEIGKAANSWRKSLTLYESPAKRPKDDRFKEIQHKLKVVEQSLHSN